MKPRRALVRQFWQRFLDNELLAPQGEFSQMAAQIAALLGSLGFLVALVLILKHAFRLGRFPVDQRSVLAWVDEAFLIRLTIATVGMVTVLIWDSLFPDRQDCLVLGPLPVRLRTIFYAKTMAIALTVGVAALAVNAFAALSFPLMVMPEPGGVARVAQSFAAYGITMAAAGAWVFLALLGVQGVLVQTLPHRLFQRISGYAQLAAFGVIVAGFFLPQPVSGGTTWYPPLWFLGAYQVLLGNRDWFFAALAGRAAAALGIAALVAAVTYGLGYARHVRRTVEQPEVAPAATNVGGASLFWFILRTLGRSRRHRLLVALCGGIGAAYVLEGLVGKRDLVAAPIYLSFFLLLGLRVAFGIPIELRANWVFRLVPPPDYAVAVRKAMLAVGAAPVLVASFLVCAPLWGGRRASSWDSC